MSSLSQLRRRYRYFVVIGSSIGIVFLVIWIHLFSQQNPLSVTVYDHIHAEQKEEPVNNPIPIAINTSDSKVVPIVDTTTIPTTTTVAANIVATTTSIDNVMATNTSTTNTSTANTVSGVSTVSTASTFPQVRRPEAKRRFTSPAVESLIEEIKTNIKNKEIAWLFENCFPNTLDTTVDFEIKEGSGKKPDTYVITGDIDAMWLRDSSAQVNPYLPLILNDTKLRQLIEGVLLRQCLFIQRDPYANAHYKDINRTSEWKQMDQTEMRPGVHERKWELDSLCYVIRLMHSYWKEVKYDLTFFHDNEQEFKKTIQIILQTMKEQQRFNGSGKIKRKVLDNCF